MIKSCYKILSKELIEYRVRKRDFYNSEEGLRELFNFLLDHKVFDLLTEQDIEVHNLGIKKLEELGLLDEGRVRDMLRTMLGERTRQSELVELEEYKKAGDDFMFDPDRE